MKPLALLLSLVLLVTAALAGDNPAANAIVSAAKSYLRTQGVAGEVRIELQAVEGNFARARVIPADGQTDPAILFLQKVGKSWRGLTLGTSFTDEDYAQLKIPRALRVP